MKILIRPLLFIAFYTLFLTSSAYAAYTIDGFPDLKITWRGREYLIAAKALRKLSTQNLPTATSKESAPFFNKLVTPQNLNYYGFTKIAIKERMTDIGDMLTGATMVLTQYFPGKLDPHYRADDFVQVVFYQLALLNTIFDTAQKFLKVTAKTDPEYSARKNGFESMRIALAKEIKGMIQLLDVKNRSILNDTQRFALANRMKKSLPHVVRELPRSFFIEHRGILQTYLKEEHAPRMRASLEDLLGVF